MSDAEDNSDSAQPDNAESIQSVPTDGVLLGIDFGTKRVGFSVCDYTQFIATPLFNYTRQTPNLDAEQLLQLARENQAVGLVVGLPVHMSGDEGGKAAEARAFGSWASEITGLPVQYQDERYTSSIAEQHMLNAGLSKKKRRERLDKVAAQVLLQAFLDSPNRGAKPGSLR